MAFSLSTGERIRMLQTRKGDGPYEFSQGHSRMTLASGGGLYVSGLLRVIAFDPAGVPVVNPETGCYAVLRKSKADPTLRVARIYADSALVFTRDTPTKRMSGAEPQPSCIREPTGYRSTRSAGSAGSRARGCWNLWNLSEGDAESWWIGMGVVVGRER